MAQNNNNFHPYQIEAVGLAGRLWGPYCIFVQFGVILKKWNAIVQIEIIITVAYYNFTEKNCRGKLESLELENY